jgi:hypothetical protein
VQFIEGDSTTRRRLGADPAEVLRRLATVLGSGGLVVPAEANLTCCQGPEITVLASGILGSRSLRHSAHD